MHFRVQTRRRDVTAETRDATAEAQQRPTNSLALLPPSFALALRSLLGRSRAASDHLGTPRVAVVTASPTRAFDVRPVSPNTHAHIHAYLHAYSHAQLPSGLAHVLDKLGCELSRAAGRTHVPRRRQVVVQPINDQKNGVRCPFSQSEARKTRHSCYVTNLELE